ncbi:MAG: hypothetical protein ABR582_08735 [Gemmatimonadaceae bacterium]
MDITSGAGPGLDPDSMSYIGAATSFAQHGTLRVPSTSWDEDDSTAALSVWPPGFSIAMAVPQKLGASRYMSARIIMSSAAFVSATTLFLLLVDAAGPWAAAAGVTGIFATPAINGVHLSVLSEPLFLACLALTLLAMVRQPRRPFIAGAAAAAAAIVRYAGVCSPVAVVLWFFFSGNKSIRERLIDSAKATTVPVIVIGAWVIRNSLLPDAQSGMEVSIYGHFLGTFREGLSTIADWLGPGLEGRTLRAASAIVMCCALIIVGVTAASTIRAREKTVELLKADLLMLSCYVATLLAARLFVGDAIPFDFRILSPAIFLAEIAITVCVAAFVSGAGRMVQVATAVIALLWLSGSVFVSGQNAIDAIADGSDFASSDWRTSPTVAWVNSRSDGHAIFSNWPAAIYFRTNRIARDVPQSLDTADMNEFADIMREKNGVFVAFSSRNTDYPASDSIASGAGLIQAGQFADGKLWIAPARRAR